MLTNEEIKTAIRILLKKYNAEYALLFGSYARGDADSDSDIDVVVFGGAAFKPTDIFAFGEDLREITGKEADVFEIRELNTGTQFYDSVLREGIRVA